MSGWWPTGHGERVASTSASFSGRPLATMLKWFVLAGGVAVLGSDRRIGDGFDCDVHRGRITLGQAVASLYVKLSAPWK